MNHDVQFIPVVIPGSDEILHLKILNMVLCGTIFVLVAVWARKVTVTTQNTVVGFMTHFSTPKDNSTNAEEMVSFVNKTDDHKTDGKPFESAYIPPSSPTNIRWV